MSTGPQNVPMALTAEAVGDVLDATKAIRKLLSGHARGWNSEATPDVISREISRIKDSGLPLVDSVGELQSWVHIFFRGRLHDAYGGRYRVKQCALQSLASIEIRAARYRDRTGDLSQSSPSDCLL
jgi:hypothetical protein